MTREAAHQGAAQAEMRPFRRAHPRAMALGIALTAILALGCDREGRKKCAWTLEPEPKNIGKTHKGLIPLCARNREDMKQDCRLQGTLEFAKSAWGRKFRYTDLEVESFGIPRTIKSVDYCDK